MKAVAQSLRFLGEGKKLSIPFFQRHYVWKEENWKELLDSFDNIDDSMPFLGSIILKERSMNEEIVIDGQQRLTTITILAKALYDCLSDASKASGSGIRNGVENYLFYRDNASDDFISSHVKIMHSKIDNADYFDIISSRMLNSNVVDINTIDESSSNIYRCYKYFCEEFQMRDELALKKLFNAMFDDNKKIFVLITLEFNDINEQRIFDTINRAGVRLSSADIIKNNLFEYCLGKCKEENHTENDVYQLYSEKWEKLFYSSVDERNIWDAKRIFGNVERTNLEFLLYCVATIKWGKTKEIFSDLEKVYNDGTYRYSYSEMETLICEINLYAEIFKNQILDFHSQLSNNDISIQYTEHVKRLFLILDVFGVQMFYPYVLKRLREVNMKYKDESLVHDFNILESFVVRRRLSGKGVTDYATKCDQILSNGISSVLIPELISNDSGINDYNIGQYVKKVNNDTAKIILYCIELFKRSHPNFDISSLHYFFTLEHIIPRSWQKNWDSISVYSEDGSIINDENERIVVRNSAVQNIGNMILLATKLNTSVSNNSFSVKVDGIDTNGKERSSYRSYSTMLLTKEIIDAYDKGDKVWDEQHVHNRSKILLDNILTIWPNYSSEYKQKEQLNILPDVSSKLEPTVDDFTDDDLSDPIKLLDALNNFPNSSFVAEKSDEKHNYKQTDLSFIFNVQRETIQKRIREGDLLPDVTEDIGGQVLKYYSEENLREYAVKNNWKFISDKDMKTNFIEFTNKMTMSYSYKPLFLKALLILADNTGCVSMKSIVDYFKSYYNSRLANGLIAEKDNSVFNNSHCSYKDAQEVILKYPYDRFAQQKIVDYNGNNIIINPLIWNRLWDNEKKSLLALCDKFLEQYFEKISSIVIQ